MEIDKIPTSINLNLTHDNDGMGGITPEEAVDNLINFSDGFIKCVEKVEFGNVKIMSKFLDDIEKKFGKLKKYEYDTSGNGLTKMLNDRIRIYTSVYEDEDIITASWYTKSEDDLHESWKLYKDHTKSGANITRISKHEFYMDDGRCCEATKELSRKNIDFISKSYYPYIDTDLMFDQFFTGQENILLLVGESGLGKSKLSTLALKYAIENPDKLLDTVKYNDDNYIHIAYVKSVDVLTKDNFWTDIGSCSNCSYSMVIIDDLDYMLTKRDAEVLTSDDAKKNAFINQFLSFTDGLVKNKTKFIITSNQPYENIDHALLRKGRLFDILELRKLLKDEAKNIWLENNLKVEEFDKVFKDQVNILAADLGSEISKRLNKKIKERACMPYLKEAGISKVFNASRSKKIGL